jgi:hypothetical protein
MGDDGLETKREEEYDEKEFGGFTVSVASSELVLTQTSTWDLLCYLSYLAVEAMCGSISNQPRRKGKERKLGYEAMKDESRTCERNMTDLTSINNINAEVAKVEWHR